VGERRPLRVAVVGAGPAGMYAAGHLLGSPGGTYIDGRLVQLTDMPVEVDMLERLPTPWGLVRGAVAPDHPEKKLVTRVFEAIAARPGFRFFGNVEIGRDIRPAELAQWYDAVIYAVGAASDPHMGIPGEELPGCWSAREFVAWYSGHPDFADLHLPSTTPSSTSSPSWPMSSYSSISKTCPATTKWFSTRRIGRPYESLRRCGDMRRARRQVDLSESCCGS
jgi:hypothetical protein